ncbi:hypothetical protein KDA_35800 [Dictyobacter alpinus]|uniref:Uncharacterized protein n=1 Tax=Dictyobacter alpinus TaxID=2014873 RepID=A0A402B9U2_9CHLR|nr:hypothetical protein [Dictyobacter alpinus]GCE28096.1 hypothetical protein KDA_35800 [Dictyobacter alpinus]
MSDYVGSCLFFESNQTRDALITATLNAMELLLDSYDVRLPDEDGFPRFAGEGYPVRTEATPELSLAALVRLESGIIEAEGPDQRETIWFDPKVGPYPVITIWVVDSAMYYEDWPEYSEAFVKRWLQLCEQGKAVFGYFSPFEHMFELTLLETQFLPLIQSGDSAQLLAPSDVYWLAYLGPELAQNWRQQQMPLPETVHPRILQELPSRAHFLRMTTSVYGD